MTASEIVELMEPKLPPINLWCLVPASYFYRGEVSINPGITTSRVDLYSALRPLYNQITTHR